jgi:predicted nucleic acid-binding protein
MRFWDSSAIVPLLVGEASSEGAAHEYRRDPEIVVWWSTGIECVSALARLERDGDLPSNLLTEALARLDAVLLAAHEVQPVERVRLRATRLLRVHPLRAADSLQLASAIVAAEDQPKSLPFVTLDERLALAAQREGFSVLVPSSS